MRSPGCSLRSLIAVAARLRAGGLSWEAISQEVQRSERAVRYWPERFPDEWEKYYRVAEERNLADAASEALVFLRKNYRDKDGRISTASNKFVVGIRREAIYWKEKRAAASQPADSSLLAFLPQLEAMSNEELKQFVLDFAAKHLVGAGASGRESDGAGSPAQPA